MTGQTTERATASRAAEHQSDWRRTYARRLAFTDLLVLVWIVFGTQITWLGLGAATPTVDLNHADAALSYTVISIVIVGTWMLSLSVFGTRGYRVAGVGSTEYKYIFDGSLRLFGLVAIAAFLFKIDLARGYILLAFPLGTVVLIFSRWMWRQWLGVQRQQGKYSSRVLLVGSVESAAHIAQELARQPQAGYHVVGACVPAGGAIDHLPDTGVPIAGTVDSVMHALASSHADTVVITSADELSPQRVRQLSWDLEPGHYSLVVAPSLSGIGGPRIHTRPLTGLPLVHVETPRYEGGKLFAKRAFDLLTAGLLTVLLSPVLIAIAIAIAASSPGGVLFHQQRVGLNGKPFTMLKFRSMLPGAEGMLQALHQQHDAGNDVLFKMQRDPRVTPIGRVLRRYSLDELPQLFNVLQGQMSLVGPRPPLATEVSLYEQHVHRRFLVKPGVTGLWQVSGRSDLSWEDTVRLDLFYVENWSILSDLTILWRTGRAVVSRAGAY